jgi:poly(A) polymerase
MLRLFRFQCRFGWTIPESVLATVRAQAHRVKILSAERIRDELLKMIATGRLGEGLERMRACGLMDVLFPELVPMVGCSQDPLYHSEGDVWVHTLEVMSRAPATVLLQLAALLHDIGKPGTRSVSQSSTASRVKFLGHEKLSAEMSRAFLKRLKFDSATIEKVTHLVALHLRGGDVEAWTSLKPARKFLRDVGPELLEPLLELIAADSASSHGPDGQARVAHVGLLRRKLNEAQVIPLEAQVIPLLTRPILSGHEIMELLNINPGPDVGRALAYLEQLEDEYASRGEALSRDQAHRELVRKWSSRP